MQLLPNSSRRALARVLIVFLGVYLALCIYLYARQDRFIFLPIRAVENTPKDFGCEYIESTLVSEGKKIQVWRLPAQAENAAKVGGRSLLYLHGNAGNLGHNSAHACRLAGYGFNVFIFDYRGYGKSEGEWPNEESVYEDAEVAWQAMAKDEPDSKKIIIYGHSLGGAVAVDLASKHPEAGGLIVESSFTSVKEMADADPVFRYFPLSLLIHQKLDSRSKLPSLNMPVLFIHGTADRVVPPFMSKLLYDAAREPKKLVFIQNGDHDSNALIAGKTYSVAIYDFLASIQHPAATAATKENK